MSSRHGHGFIELRADGTLLVDRFDGEATAEFTVTDAELEDAVAVLTDDALIYLLRLDQAPCITPTDIYEGMTLNMSGEEIHNSVTFCDNAALTDARATLNTLADAYAPME